MRFSAARFVTRLPCAAAVMMFALLLTSVSVDAAIARSGVNKSKKPVAAKVAERGKRPFTKAKSTDGKRGSTRAVTVAAKGAKGQIRKSSTQVGKIVTRSGKRVAVAQKTSSATRVARARMAPRAERVVSARRSSLNVRLAFHRRPSSAVRVMAMPRLSNGERLGLRSSDDPLELSSSVALVIDQKTHEVLFSKNDAAVLPIASLTKLMTGLVVADANLSMDELLSITQDDVDTFKGSRSRLSVGSTLSRGELMHLALMSSENRAAHALGRTFPGGLEHFVRLMNAKARELGMQDTRYVEPTGLSSLNQSSARDLATLVSAAYERPILRSLSTSPRHQLDVGHRTLEFVNSNRLVRDPEWEIGLQKTGYISEAGRCLVMQAKVAGRQLIMVFLDSAGKLSRTQDAERVRRWVEAQTIFSEPAVIRPQG